MSNRFTNTHIHVFNTRCAPDNFLRVVSKSFVRKYPKTIKRILDSNAGKWAVRGLFNVTDKRDAKSRKELEKYIAFLEVAGSDSQLRVFEKALEAAKHYDPHPQIVALTLNMDFMDTDQGSSHINFETQLEGVKEIKRYYPNNFFPFLSVDPRHLQGDALMQFCVKYFETGTEDNQQKWHPYFSGLKLYPALGFFPFHIGLEAAYSYAVEKNVPVMTHCTRVGSQYVGSMIETLIADKPSCMLPAGIDDQSTGHPAIVAKQNIYQRIKNYREANLITNSKTGENDAACDLFGNPENYVPVLETFPTLRLCLAHMGGSPEIVATKDQKKEFEKVWQLEDGVSWFDRIRTMMVNYPNLYTDISYTLSDLAKPDFAQKITAFMETPDRQGKKLGKRVLFGTDFFMTEQENREVELYRLAKIHLAAWWEDITCNNAATYLGLHG